MGYIFEIMVCHLNTDNPFKLLKLRSYIHFGMNRSRFYYGNHLSGRQGSVDLHSRNKSCLFCYLSFFSRPATEYDS